MVSWSAWYVAASACRRPCSVDRSRRTVAAGPPSKLRQGGGAGNRSMPSCGSSVP
jgi:hypothetical protein